MSLKRRGAIALGLFLVTVGSARSDEVADLLEPFAREPSVRELQGAATRFAEIHPERVRAWQRRVRTAPLAPSLRLTVGRGGNMLYATHSADGIDRFTVDSGDLWRFDVSAIWTLDRLVFDHNELRASRESQRVAARREALLTEVAELYFERRRAQVALASGAARSPFDRVQAILRIDELTAILDGLTDGALSRTGAKGER